MDFDVMLWAWLGLLILAGLVCSLFGAVAILAIVSKIVDTKRMGSAPDSIYEMGAPGDMESLPTRTPPLISSGAREKVARLCQVVHRMRSGDPGTYGGTALHSYMIRISTWSSKSHAFILDVENEGSTDAVAYIIDTTLKHGVTRRPLAEAVAAEPGKYYWSPVTGEASRHYHRMHAIEAAMEMVRANTRYGWGAIIFQLLIKLPTTAVVMHVTGLGKWSFFRRWPFCSGALAIWMRKGSMDICKDREPELIVPQDVDQCPLFGGWVALFP